MDQTVQFAPDHAPSWPAVRDLLAACGFPLQLRMIDGELAFPDEEPSEAWSELRLATRDGQAITVKRDDSQFKLVVWGNADAKLIQSWNAVTWAFAQAGQGTIQTESGGKTAAEYRRQAELPPEIKA
jgi:hypothetical protein